MYYQNVWREFKQSKRTLASDKRNYPEWHMGRKRYLVWAIEIENPLVLLRWNNARKCLANHIVQPYQRAAHITIAVAGFLSSTPQLNDDIGQHDLDRQAKAIELLGIGKFSLELAGLNSFLSAPFLEVIDIGGYLLALRSAIYHAYAEIRTVDYIPHITLGIFRQHFLTEEVMKIILANQCEDRLVINIERISLMSYAANDIGSLLKVEKNIFL